jgi:hypothetical protein
MLSSFSSMRSMELSIWVVLTGRLRRARLNEASSLRARIQCGGRLF